MSRVGKVEKIGTPIVSRYAAIKVTPSVSGAVSASAGSMATGTATDNPFLRQDFFGHFSVYESGYNKGKSNEPKYVDIVQGMDFTGMSEIQISFFSENMKNIEKYEKNQDVVRNITDDGIMEGDI